VHHGEVRPAQTLEAPLDGAQGTVIAIVAMVGVVARLGGEHQPTREVGALGQRPPDEAFTPFVAIEGRGE